MDLKVFYSSVSCNRELKKNQEKIFMILDSKSICYEAVDVTQDEEAKLAMRRIANDSKALPPQICKGDIYCGDFAAFFNAVECEELEKFLKL
ncbi:SH3 domain-binding glutamic acid-rich-like protein 3 [Nelusetta ayraudi]|uniref:SH3 domain-binding glutamic acid-rich-like protein 3 n=1 Tax=Nelusetta ayraudi TaxID=303726 RepID=UPI003F7181BC